MMKNNSKLPPGQREIDEFPRFGLTPYAKRYKDDFGPIDIRIGEQLEPSISLKASDLQELPRIDLNSDFHCVTTWTKTNLQWSGFRFKDLYTSMIKNKVKIDGAKHYVIMRSLDGFRASFLLEDLLLDDVILADRLNGEALTAKHGAPIRLISPAQYGYKNIKHLKAIEFWPDLTHFKPTTLKFMIHLRARVAHEERGLWFPQKLLRILYRPLINSTIALFKRTMHSNVKKNKEQKP